MSKSDGVNGSQSFLVFSNDLKDVDRLFEIHKEMTKGVSGSHHNLDPINKSIVVLLCAAWEAYVENVAQEAVKSAIGSGLTASALPNGMRERVIARIFDKDEPLSPWDLAGHNWQLVVEAEIERMCDGLNGGLNTPNSKNVSKIFRSALGINITESWRWQRMKPDNARKKLNKLVAERGTYAHGGVPDRSARIGACWNHRTHVSRIVESTDYAVNARVRDMCGQPMYPDGSAP